MMAFKAAYYLFCDGWKLYRKYRKYAGRPLDDAGWEALVCDGESICRKYDFDPFAVGLVSAVLDEFERAGRDKGHDSEKGGMGDE